jgi:hypothetical protein
MRGEKRGSLKQETYEIFLDDAQGRASISIATLKRWIENPSILTRRFFAGSGVAAQQNRCEAAPVVMARLQQLVSKNLFKNAVKIGQVLKFEPRDWGSGPLVGHTYISLNSAPRRL